MDSVSHSARRCPQCGGPLLYFDDGLNVEEHCDYCWSFRPAAYPDEPEDLSDLCRLVDEDPDVRRERAEWEAEFGEPLVWLEDPDEGRAGL
jgi:hypothetical protein